MSIMSRFTLRSLKGNMFRTVVSIIGIALACALLTAVCTSVVTFQNLLEQRTIADEGSWQVQVENVTPDQLQQLANSSRLNNAQTVTELGAIKLGDKNASQYGDFLYLKTWPEELSSQTNSSSDQSSPALSLPTLVSGRAPQTSSEIVLPNYLEGAELAPCGLSASGKLELGSTVTLDLGTRSAVDTTKPTREPSTIVSSQGTWLREANADQPYAEEFSPNLGTRTFTVVGFVRENTLGTNLLLSQGAVYTYDPTALSQAATDTSDATRTSVAFSLVDTKSIDDLIDFTTMLFGEKSSDNTGLQNGNTYSLHRSLLRWQGIFDNRSIWESLWGLALVLSAVIVIAGVSVIYNAFAISVAERTRQFGLLASLGASRRQLRKAVLTEGLLLGCIGIPVGLLLGIIGCEIVFSINAKGLLSIVGGTFSQNTTIPVVISLPVLALTALASLATILISAWIPAMRASKVSAIEAIQQNRTYRISRKALRRAAKPHKTKHQSPVEKLFGTPGYIAHRNLTRGASRHRVTVASLAVSVALIVIAGFLAMLLTYMSNASGITEGQDGENSQDIIVSFPTTTFADDPTRALDTIRKVYTESCEQDDVEGAGWSIGYYGYCAIPNTMLSSDATKYFAKYLDPSSEQPNDIHSSDISIQLVDETTWHSYINALGLDENVFCDKSHPRAVLINAYQTSIDGKYAELEPFASTGTVQIASPNTSDTASSQNPFEGNETSTVQPVEIGALAKTLPSCVSASGIPQLILPEWAADTMSAGTLTTISASFSCNNNAEVSVKVADSLRALYQEHHGDIANDIDIYNLADSRAQTRLIAQTMQLFIYCFAVITGLIAIANAFNTLVNSLILRKREFAVLRSVGMGPRAFRSMLAYECVSYALRGFVIGLILAALAGFGMYAVMQAAFADMDILTLIPLQQIGFAALLVLFVIVISVRFALRRSQSENIVESLRADAL